MAFKLTSSNRVSPPLSRDTSSWSRQGYSYFSWLCLLTFIVPIWTATPPPVVNVLKVQPNVGSMAGGTVLTVTGSGFPSDYFASSVGVFLYPDITSRPPTTYWYSTNPIKCDILPYLSSTTKIVCRTRSLEIDLDNVASLRTQPASADSSATDSNIQANDAYLQLMDWSAQSPKNFKVDYQVIVVVGDYEESNIIAASKSLTKTYNSFPKNIRGSFCAPGYFHLCYFTYSQEATPVILGVNPSILPSDVALNNTLATLQVYLPQEYGYDIQSITIGGGSTCEYKDPLTNQAISIQRTIYWQSRYMSIKCRLNNIFGTVSGNIIPNSDIQPWGYSAVSKQAVNFAGGGRKSFQQVYPVIHYVDQTSVSPLGGAIMTIQGSGFIPLTTFDKIESEEISTLTVTELFASAGTLNITASDGALMTKKTVSVPFNSTQFAIQVAGVPCLAFEFSWISSPKFTNRQQIACRIGDLSAVFGNKYLSGFRGMRQDSFNDISLTVGVAVESMLLNKEGDSVTYYNQSFLDIPTAPSAIVWKSPTKAQKTSTFFTAPFSSNYSFFLSSFGTDMVNIDSQLELIVTMPNGTRSLLNTFKHNQASYDTAYNGRKGSWTAFIPLKKDEMLFIEIIEWLPSGIFAKGGAGKPVLYTKAAQVPLSSVSSSVGGGIETKDTECIQNQCIPGYKWTWDVANSDAAIPEIQQISFDPGRSIEMQTVTLKLSKLNASAPIQLPTGTAISWMNVDGNYWNAGNERVRLTWGLPSGNTVPSFIEFTATSTAAQVETAFSDKLLTSHCLWAEDRKRVFYHLNQFELSGNTEGWSGASVSTMSQYCGRQALQIKYGSSFATLNSYTNNITNIYYNFVANTNVYPHVCMAMNVDPSVPLQMVVNINGYGQRSFAIIGNPWISKVGDWKSSWTYGVDASTGNIIRSDLSFKMTGGWQYRCINWKEQIEQVLGIRRAGSVDANGNVDRFGGYNILSLSFDSQSAPAGSSKYFYIDQLSISSTPLPLVQTSSSAVNTFGTVLDYVKVEKTVISSVEVVFSFSMVPLECGAPMDPISISFVNETTTTTQFKQADISSGSNSIVLTSQVGRAVAQSSPIDGWYTLQMNGFPLVNISVLANASTIENLFKTAYAPTANGSPIQVSGTQDCYSFSYDIVMNAFPGQQPLLNVVSSRITGGRSMRNVSVVEMRPGALVLAPIPADLLSTSHYTTSYAYNGSTVASYPIQVKMNDISAACRDSRNCSLPVVVLPDEHVPVISSVSPSIIRKGDTLIIRGSRFTTWSPAYKTESIYSGLRSNVTFTPNAQGNVTLVSERARFHCGSLAFNDTVATCIIPESLPAGYPVDVRFDLPLFGVALRKSDGVTGSKLARRDVATVTLSSSSLFPVVQGDLYIQRVSPMSGSISGGTLLSLYGEGFGSMANATRITLKGINATLIACNVVESNVTVTRCYTGPLSRNQLQSLTAQGASSLTFNITVETLFVNGVTSAQFTMSDGFTYSVGATAQVSSIKPKTGSILGGDVITLFGESLLPLEGSVQVLLNDQECVVMTVNATQIQCKTPSSTMSGFVNIKVITGIMGVATVLPSVSFEYEIKTLYVNGLEGSMFGGRSIWIQGLGFCSRSIPNCHLSHNLKVQFDDKLARVTASNYTHLQVIVPDYSREYVITNEGEHPRLGRGFAFSPSYLAITVGDAIEFKWTGLGNTTDAAPHILQVVPENVVGSISEPVSSTNNQSEGVFRVKFDQPGSYSFINGKFRFRCNVDVNPFYYGNQTHTMYSKIVVYAHGLPVPYIAPIVSSTTTQTMYSTSAIMSSFSGSSLTMEKSSVAALIGASSAMGALPASSAMGALQESTVLSDTVYSTSSITTATLSLSAESPISSGGTGALPAATGLPDALTGIASQLGPQSVSTQGQLLPMSFSSLSSSFITTMTMISNNPYVDYSVAGITFLFQASKTPFITSVSQLFGQGSLTYAIRGGHFVDDTKQVQVMFGDRACTASFVNTTHIDCQVASDLDAGLYAVQVNVSLAGVSLPFYYKQVFQLSRVSPMKGSFGGGNTIDIVGGNLPSVSYNQFSILFGQTPCLLVSSNSTLITCTSTRAVGLSNTDVSLPSMYNTTVNVIWKTSSFGIHNPKPVSNETMDYYNLTQRLESALVFSFDKQVTPIVSFISQTVGFFNQNVTLMGSSFHQNTTVAFDDVPCEKTFVNSTFINCTMGLGVMGVKIPRINTTFGNAWMNPETRLSFTTQIIKVWPNVGSLSGSTTVNIQFSKISLGSFPSTNITLGGSDCRVNFLNVTHLRCITAPKLGSQDTPEDYPSISINNATADFTGCNLNTCGFKFGMAVTPLLTSSSPSQGSFNQLIDIVGANFGQVASDVIVSLGDTVCPIVNVTTSKIVCKVGRLEGGRYAISVFVNGRGIAIGSSYFTYIMNVDMSARVIVGGMLGGDVLEINGDGFSNTTLSTLCNKECTVVTMNSTRLTCLTPSWLDASATSLPSDPIPCNLTLANGQDTALTALQYIYTPSKTPVVLDISPKSGGTAGGTVVTITGQGFYGDKSNTTVIMGGGSCNISSINQTTIICSTGPCTYCGVQSPSIVISGMGKSFNPNQAAFTFIDKWSSPFTWGNSTPPVNGESVWVPVNKTVVLDTDSAKLNLLLIEGTLIFDSSKNVTLQARYIFIHNGGRLQIGTPDQPFTNFAKIRLWGSIRDRPLPVYGTKVLAVRSGYLELYGKPYNQTWTRLGATAAPGDTQIKLRTFVDWPVGGHIVLSSTLPNPGLVDEAIITGIQTGPLGSILTLDRPLVYRHSGVVDNIAGKKVDLAGEVALLSRHIVIEGVLNNDAPLVENNADQFGGHVMVHPSASLKQYQPYARVSYVEFRNMGQAFQLGRYPMHFHMNADVGPRSFVKGCAIHHTFNRALTAHGVFDLNIESNVAYNIMGHTFFVEDGIEERNNFIGNLGIWTRISFSLLNTDQIPATFWITHPNNNYIGNVAAGSEGSGFFYNLQQHPTGPSETFTVCPVGAPLGTFANNTAHSCDFGFRIWETYLPKRYGCYGDLIPVTYHNFTGWMNRRGAEISVGGSLELKNFILAENTDFQLVWSDIISEWGGPSLNGGLIVSHSVPFIEEMELTMTPNGGINTPGTAFLTIHDTAFVNFDLSRGFCLTPCSFCKPFDAAFETRLSKSNLINSTDRVVAFEHEHHGWYTDLDGSLTGDVGSIRPSSNILPYDECYNNIGAYSVGAVSGAWCSAKVSNIRFGVKQVEPISYKGQNLLLLNENGEKTAIPWREKRRTDPFGYTGIVVANQTYSLGFEVADKDTVDVTGFRSGVYQLPDYSWVMVQMKFRESLDHFNINNQRVSLNRTPTTNDPVGSWTFNNDTKELLLMITNANSQMQDIPWSFSLEKCPIGGCPIVEPPAPPPVEVKRFYWSDASKWPNQRVPTREDDVIINIDTEIILDVDGFAKNIHIFGNLSFYELVDLNLHADNIHVHGTGKLQIGSVLAPFEKKARIYLYGHRDSPTISITERIHPGSKCLAVFGKVEIVGKRKTNLEWTRLEASALKGTNGIQLRDPVDWSVGDEIVLASSSYEPHDAEKATIYSISADGKQITLEQPLIFDHSLAGSSEFKMQPEVALLSRDIVIQGADDEYSSIYGQAFGARVYVAGYLNLNSSSVSAGLNLGNLILENVRIVHGGQNGFTSFSDFRAAITFDYGEVGIDDLARSRVSRCVISDSFNTGIAVVGSGAETAAMNVGGMPVDLFGNIVFNTTGSSYKIFADDVNLSGNLGFLTKFGIQNSEIWVATFEVMGVPQSLKDNAAGGSESMGILMRGIGCSLMHLISNNTVHSNIYGAVVLGRDRFEDDSCVGIGSHSVWKNWMIGVFSFMGASSLKITGLQAADSRLGYLGFFIGPSAILHQTTDKDLVIADSLFVGYSSNEECIDPEAGPSILQKFRDNPQSYFILPNHVRKTGFMFPVFLDNSGGMIRFRDYIEKGAVTSWPILNGRSQIINTQFTNFTQKCSAPSFAITNNYDDDDTSKPLYMRNVTTVSTDENSKLFFYEPNPRWIDPILCVDMDCDGLKHSMVVDETGTFFGSGDRQWTAVPDASIRFNPKFVPVIMKTDLEGNMVADSQVYSSRGVYLYPDCQFKSSWDAFACPSSTYNLLVIESMDSDTLTRRASPVGLLAKDNARGHVMNLLNGPKNLGWCAHYSCLRRPSTYYGLVATNLTYQLAFTGTNPSSLRLMNLYANAQDAIKLIIDWTTSQRLDVYVNDKLVNPTDFKSTSIRYDNLDSFDPTLAMTSGSSFYRIDLQQMTVIVKGSSPVLIKSSPAVLISFGLTVENADTFFDSGKLIDNLAKFLNIDPIKIKIVSVVPESNPSFRLYKRGPQKFNVKIRLSNPAPTTLVTTTTMRPTTTTLRTTTVALSTTTTLAVITTSTTASTVTSDALTTTTTLGSSTTTQTPVPSVIDSTSAVGNSSLNQAFNDQIQKTKDTIKQQNELLDLASKLVVGMQSDASKVVQEATVTSFEVKLPPPVVIPSVPPTLANSTTANDLVLNLTMDALTSSTNTSSAVPIVFQIPSQMLLSTKIGAVYYVTLPKLVFQVLDASGKAVSNLGLGDTQWSLKATLYANQTESDLLLGTKVQPFLTGVATFSDLSIKESGTNYSLGFVPFTGPTAITRFAFSSSQFSFSAIPPPTLPTPFVTDIPIVITESIRVSLPAYGVALIALSLVGVFILSGYGFIKYQKKKKNLKTTTDVLKSFAKGNKGKLVVPDIVASHDIDDRPDKSSENLSQPDKKPLSFYYEAVDHYIPDPLFPDELAIEIGDIIQASAATKDQEWYIGVNTTKNKAGRFPAKCVRPLGFFRSSAVFQHSTDRDHLPPIQLSVAFEEEKNRALKENATRSFRNIPKLDYEGSDDNLARKSQVDLISARNSKLDKSQIDVTSARNS